MGKTVAIGIQSFETIIERNCFYIDKTSFIKEWWDSGDEVTLITRPRRFGKTLNMSMLEAFFSVKYRDRKDLFEGLEIWKYDEYRKLQGIYPVIFLSFARVKGNDYYMLKAQIVSEISRLYRSFDFIFASGKLPEKVVEEYKKVCSEMDDAVATASINFLSECLYKYYGKKVLILLDEYDTPMQEAYTSGYWSEISSFFRNLFNATLKTNPYLERAVMTGITRVSKESMFSDLNNLKVVTTTSDEYATSFGFTEDEVFKALDEIGRPEEKKGVKEWYDGFCFGSHRDIYNPWSIINFLDNGKYRTYWADTSSNGLLSSLLKVSGTDQKRDLETLIHNGSIKKKIDEQIIFSQLDSDNEAVWSLMLATGYLRVDDMQEEGIFHERIYTLKATNLEVIIMLNRMVRGWFGTVRSSFNNFTKALLNGNRKEMNIYMNQVSLATFSYFDTGNHPSEETQPERFYHGFVLGLISDLSSTYHITSNRESGYGRYDVMLQPLNKEAPAFIFEFKVFDPEEEKDLQETVSAAKAQIEEKKYAEHLIKEGVSPDRIRKYGFAFQGKKVLIG